MTTDPKKARKITRILNKLQRNGYSRLLEGTAHINTEALKADINFLRDALKVKNAG